MSTDTLVHIKIDAYGDDRDSAIAALRAALTHLGSGFNGGHGRTPYGRGRYVVQYLDGQEETA
jgi:hypothetical protein